MCIGFQTTCLLDDSMALNQAELSHMAGLSVDAGDESADQEADASSTIDRSAFDELLSWLAPDPDAAGQQYELIRRKLIALFRCRGCLSPEDLADETINRVIKKLPLIKPGYVGNPISY